MGLISVDSPQIQVSCSPRARALRCADETSGAGTGSQQCARQWGNHCASMTLRHGHVALLIAAGEHPKVIAQRFGHNTIRTSLDTYGHLFPGMDEAAADRLEAMRSRASVSKTWPTRNAEVVSLNP